MEFQDKGLTCMDCVKDFVFTAGEQLFFHDKQFKNEPKRCKFCKAKRTATFGPVGPGAAPVYNKVETRTICSHCNKETTVPFRPSQGQAGSVSRVLPAKQGGGGGLNSTARLWQPKPSPFALP